MDLGRQVVCRQVVILVALTLLIPWSALAGNENTGDQTMGNERLNHPQAAETPTDDTVKASDPPGAEDPAQPSPASEAAAAAQEVVYDRVMVVGNPENASRIPGSAHLISQVELEKYHYSDIHRILRQVPGINLQDEEGFGLRPNIGIRGTGVERSQKITLMEDGVLVAPAPYAAPAAYYLPTAGRMEALEVRKGSAAIKQGPFSNGGAINLISTSIPQDFGGKVQLSFGDHETNKLHANVGASLTNFGFLVETFQQRSEGFKELDTKRPDGSDSTGFDLSDYLVKLRVNTDQASIYQALELKLGRTDQDSDETYLGLTRDDFARTPLRRYAASQLDHLDTEHEQLQLRHFIQPRKNLDLTTTLYRNDFSRNWYKNETTLGTSNGRILSEPDRYANELALLRGERDSPANAFVLRNNRRDYYGQGLQSILGWQLEHGHARHEFEFGVRFHRDEEDRFQEDDRYALRSGTLILTTAGRPGSDANRIGRASALAFFAQDQIAIGKWTLSPGFRFEAIDTERLDYGRNDPERTGLQLQVRENQITVLIPGLGVDYALKPNWNLFIGVHRGFAPPSPGTEETVDEEESTNYELGTRYSVGGLRLELVGFFNDYANLLGADTQSSGGAGTGDRFNGGKVQVQGLEASLTTDFARSGGRLRFPFRATYTYTTGEFKSSFTTSFEDWSPQVLRGDHLPYIPVHQAFAELGVSAKAWSAFLSASYVTAMRTKAGQGPIPTVERIDDHLTFDLAGEYQLFSRYRLFAQVSNLFDETYVAATRPYGLRPGLPRTAIAGISLGF